MGSVEESSAMQDLGNEAAVGSASNNQNASSSNPSNATGQAPSYQDISPEDARQILASDTPCILVDVRSEAEYQESRIPDAVLIPLDTIRDRAAIDLPDQDMLIIVYCRSGIRAAQAAATLVDLGYTNVYNLGGIMSWPYETVS